MHFVDLTLFCPELIILYTKVYPEVSRASQIFKIIQNTNTKTIDTFLFPPKRFTDKYFHPKLYKGNHVIK